MANNEDVKTVYGRRKLGDAVYEKQQAKAPLSRRAATVYGPRKGGPAAPATASPTSSTSPTSSPPGRAGDPTPPVPLVPPVPPVPLETVAAPTSPPGAFRAGADPAGANLSIAEIERALKRKPGLLDAMIDVEFKRTAQRKGALDLFRRVELQRANPRDRVLDRLKAALADE